MLLFGLGRIAHFVLLFLTMRAMTTVLSQAEVGKVSVIMAATAFFAYLFLNPIGMFMNRQLHAWAANATLKSNLVSFFVYDFGIVILAMLSVAALRMGGLLDATISVEWIMVLTGGSLLFGTANQVFVSFVNFLGQRAWFVGLTLLTTILSFAGAIGLVTFAGPSAEHWMIGLLLGQSLAAVPAGYVLFGSVNSKEPARSTAPKGERLKRVFRFAWPAALSVGFIWIQTQGYRLIMQTELGLAQLGLFFSGFAIAVSLLNAFESVVGGYFQPDYYRRTSSNSKEQQAAAWNDYISALMPSLVVTILFLIALAPEITRVLVGQSFQDSAQFIVWGALAEGARILTGAYWLIGHARMETRTALIPGLVGAILSLAFIWLLLPLCGARGAGIAMAGAGVVSVSLSHYLMSRQLSVALPLRRTFAGALMGLAIWAALIGVRAIWTFPAGLASTIFFLLIAGLLYLAAQYVLLRPVLQRDSDGLT